MPTHRVSSTSADSHANSQASARFNQLLLELREEHERVLQQASGQVHDNFFQRIDIQRPSLLSCDTRSTARGGSKPKPPIVRVPSKPPPPSQSQVVDFQETSQPTLPGLADETEEPPLFESSSKKSDHTLDDLQDNHNTDEESPTSPHSPTAPITLSRKSNKSMSIMSMVSLDSVASLVSNSGLSAMFNKGAGDPFALDPNAGKVGVERFLANPLVELSFSVLVFINTLMIACEAQYDGIQSGYDSTVSQGHDAWRGAETPAHLVWPGADVAFLYIDFFFGVIFTTELAMKFAAMKCRALKEAWTWMDGMIVGFWLVERIAASFLPMDPKVIRVARLARLLRFLRVVKAIQGFDSLYLMMASIKSSFSALFWSSAVLLLTEMMFALLLNVLLESFWTDDSINMESRSLIYNYFGTFTRALQTMIEMLLGNWYAITRLLTEHVSEWYLIFGLLHQLCLGFAVIEVITGVFLHQTFTVANLDDGIMMNELKRSQTEQARKITRFFEAADADGNGGLDRDEFSEVLAKDSVQSWLSANGLPVHTFNNAFNLFDVSGRGEISAVDMATGAARMKGQATALELAIVRSLVEDVQRSLNEFNSATRVEAKVVGNESWSPRD